MDYPAFINSVKTEDQDLRPYQVKNKMEIYNSWLYNRAVMLQMPTGTGKTRLFVSIMKDIHQYAVSIKKQVRVLVLVHRVELIDQISDVLGVHYGLAHGYIHSQDRERRKFPFQIASVQTLNKRLDSWSDYGFDFIIVDEAHHILADSYKKIIKTFPAAKILGVTATPYRLSGAGFKPEFDVLIESEPVRKFIENGYLSKFEYYSIAPYSYIQHQIDDIKGTDVSGDYASGEMLRVCDKDSIRSEIVKTYLDFAKGKKGIVYTINKLHNKHICEAFCAQGINAVAIDSDTSSEEREKLLEDFKQGKITILCNVDIFSEGFDCPDIEFVQLARPTKSLALFMQQVGRGLRPCAEKEKTIFLDNVGLYNRFGLPDTERVWEDYFNGIEGVEERSHKASNDNKTTKQYTREADLTEGQEQVHLIHSSLDTNFLLERAKIVHECYEVIRSLYISLIVIRKYIFDDFVTKYSNCGLKFSLKTKPLCKSLKISFENSEIEAEALMLFKFLEEKRNDFLEEEDIEIDIISHQYFNENIKNDDIQTIEQYIKELKTKFEICAINKIKKEEKKDYILYKHLLSKIRKLRIGQKERQYLDIAHGFFSLLQNPTIAKEKMFFLIWKLINRPETLTTEEKNILQSEFSAITLTKKD